jgi:hypothetical protein
MEVEVVSYNKIKYKGIILNISPELIQDAHHMSIPKELIYQQIIDTYNKEISVVRNNKLKQLGI